jgi:hypothetical protein
MRLILCGLWKSPAASALLLPLLALPWACSGSPETPPTRETPRVKESPRTKDPQRTAEPSPPVTPRAAREPGLVVDPGGDVDPDVDPLAEPEPESESDPGEAPSAKPPTVKDTRGTVTSRPRDEEIKEYLKRLSSSREEAEEAFRELWEVPKDLIPQLILEVTNRSPSALNELKILVLDKRGIVRLGEEEGEIHYMIPGMCTFEVDEVAAGPAKSGKGLKVVLRNKKGFSLGVVLRAALMNRFRSAEHPRGDDRSDCVGWWQRFYDRVASGL